MIRLALAMLATATLPGCLTSGEVVPVQRYAVEPAIEVAPMASTEKTIGVRPFEVARPYQEAMVYLTEGSVLGKRNKEEWAERPREVVTRALIDALVASKRFADVGDAAAMNRPDYMLTGEVRLFRENRTVAPRQVEVEVRLVLRDAYGVEQLWADTLLATTPVEDGTASSAAKAIGHAVADIAARAAQSIAASVP